jgi:hypothetical protein
VERIGSTAPSILRSALATQPTTEGKVRFAWALAAGPTGARAARLRYADGTLRVEARSASWRRELQRARPVLLERLSGLLGPGVVTRIVITSEEDAGRGRGR